MRLREWVAAGILLTACDNAETSTVEPSEAATPAAPPMLDGPPAALRRDLRTCEEDGPVEFGEIEYGVRVSPSGQVVLVKALRSTASPALLNCTLQRLRAWGFPATAEGAAFRFSMRFGHPDAPPKKGMKRRTKEALKHHTSQLQHCYNKGLRKDPSIKGKMSYDVVISTSGSVRATVTENTGLPPEVADCTIDAIESWTLPTDGAGKGANVGFSVVFSGR